MPLTALVIRGRVYVLTSTGVVALDGRTGKTLWQVKPGKGQLAEALLTDAHHLLIGYERPSHDGDPLLVAYTFDHGTEVSHLPYPNGISHLAVWDGKVLGYNEDGTKIAVLS